MIARIIVGRGNSREVHNVPSSSNRGEHVTRRLAIGRQLKRHLGLSQASA